jgi:hypothetical protein
MDKYEFMWGVVAREFGQIARASEFRLYKASGPDMYWEVRDFLESKRQKPIFSNYLEAVKNKQIDPEGVSCISKAMVNANDIAEDHKKHFDPLDPDFQFEEDDLIKFELQFCVVAILHSMARDWEINTKYYKDLPKPDDPNLELAFLKAIFHAGKMIGKFRHKGIYSSDNTSKAGSSRWKGYVTEQEIFEAFYQIDTKGMKKNPICKEIKDYLTNREEKRAVKRRVHSVKQIRRILAEELTK